MGSADLNSRVGQVVYCKCAHQSHNEGNWREYVALQNPAGYVELFREFMLTVGFRDSNATSSCTEDALNDSAQFDGHICCGKRLVEEELALGVEGCGVVDE